MIEILGYWFRDFIGIAFCALIMLGPLSVFFSIIDLFYRRFLK